MIRNRQRSDAEEVALVRCIVVYVLTAWTTLVIPLLLGHGVLIALLCATPAGLAGIWFVARTVFKDDDQGNTARTQTMPAYEYRKPD